MYARTCLLVCERDVSVHDNARAYEVTLHVILRFFTTCFVFNFVSYISTVVSLQPKKVFKVTTS